MLNVWIFYVSFAIDYYSVNVPLPILCDDGCLGNFTGIMIF